MKKYFVILSFNQNLEYLTLALVIFHMNLHHTRNYRYYYLKFLFPNYTSIHLDIKVISSMTFSIIVCPNCETKNIYFSISGQLSAKTEISTRWDYVLSAIAGAEGIICSVGFSVYLDKDVSEFKKSGYFSGGAVTT